jgi:hypothetical protein
VITTAIAFTEKKERFRGASDMQSTMFGGSNSEAGSGGSDVGSNSGKQKPRRLGTTRNLELQKTLVVDTSNKMNIVDQEEHPLNIDEVTGMQMMQKDLVLDFQQRL